MEMGLVMICLKSYGGCAGPLMNVPCVQDRVFYFPQGHIELLPEPTEQYLRQMKNQKSPKYDLPSNKIFKEQDFFLFYQKSELIIGRFVEEYDMNALIL
ncbi:hypothetical protein HN873_034493 [Arachis hypogaea]